jgi:hypothetical protein
MKKVKHYCDDKKCKFHEEELDGEWLIIKMSGVGTASRSSSSSIGFLDGVKELDFCGFDCLKEFIFEYRGGRR